MTPFADWAQLRDHLIENYGSTPHPAAEQEIIDAYELHPSQVEKAALELIDAPNVTSPWGVLKSRAAKISAPPSNPTRPSAIDREKRISRTENWIRAAGIHIDRQTDLLLELFDDRGLLRPYAQVDLIPYDGSNHDPQTGTHSGPPDLARADDPISAVAHSDEQIRTAPRWQLSDVRGDQHLVDRMVKLWDEHRPAGIALEQDALERAAKWKAQRTIIRPPKPALQPVGAYLQPEPTDPDDDIPL